MPRWRLDAPLYNPIVAYVIIMAALAVGIWMIARVAVLICLISYSNIIAWPLGLPRPDTLRIPAGGWLKWFCLGVAAATVWIKGMAWPTGG